MLSKKGRLKVWKQDQGFGFIKPDEEGRDVFVHIRDFGNLSRPPRVGDVIHYQPVRGADGRYRAADVQVEGVPRGARPTRAGQQRKRRVTPASGSRLGASMLALALLCAALFFGYARFGDVSGRGGDSIAAQGGSDALIRQAFQQHASNLQVSASGVVARLLPDDLDGSRHQKFIVRLASGQTLLIAHNIDLAPRIDGLREGDSVAFNGEYEWNPQGGVVHWTHLDPAGTHPSGWIKHDGRIYQ